MDTTDLSKNNIIGSTYERTTRSMRAPKKLSREVRRLHTSYNPTQDAMNVAVALVGGTMDGYENPETFREAWNHKDPVERSKWRVAIKKEFGDMIKRKVWNYTSVSNIPPNRRLIGVRFVNKLKGNGVYRARLVAKGYT